MEMGHANFTGKWTDEKIDRCLLEVGDMSTMAGIGQEESNERTKIELTRKQDMRKKTELMQTETKNQKQTKTQRALGFCLLGNGWGMGWEISVLLTATAPCGRLLLFFQPTFIDIVVVDSVVNSMDTVCLNIKTQWGLADENKFSPPHQQNDGAHALTQMWVCEIVC